VVPGSLVKGATARQASGDVIAQAGDGQRVDALGQRYEHVVGPRDPDEVTEEAAPGPTEGLKAVHRAERDVLAAAGEAPAAARAASAADLERDDDPLPYRDRADLAADLDDLADPLVTDWERAGERRRSVDQRGVQIAGCDRDRADQGILVVGQPGGRDVAPLDPALLDEEQLLHLVASWHPRHPGVRPSAIAANARNVSSGNL
jgi:hypothetical protein